MVDGAGHLRVLRFGDAALPASLRPDRHGIVHNNFRDPQLGVFMSKEESARDGRFWQGEPIWSGAEKADIASATMFWPGSEAEIAGKRPRYWRKWSPRDRLGQAGYAPPCRRVFAGRA